ncbi:MAG TPA: hypothetical protein VFQ26_01480 [Nitrospiraceae bacterium]|nr:hypothetical protein [Nitrospiraceae bacterium]
MKEANVDVRREYIDVAKCGIFDASRRVAVVQELGNVFATAAHLREPRPGDFGKFRAACVKPPVYLRLMSYRAIEPEKTGHG